MFSSDDIEAMRTATAYDNADQKIGPVSDVYIDDTTGQPTWVTVQGGLFSTVAHFVPLDGAAVVGERLVLGFAKDAITSAPKLADDDHLGVQDEDRLYAYYGLSAPTAPTDAPAPLTMPVTSEELA